jgi:hypothetical protein
VFIVVSKSAIKVAAVEVLLTNILYIVQFRISFLGGGGDA